MADNERSPTTNLEDTSLIAFMLLKGHKIREWQNKEDPSRVSFDIEGSPEDVEKDMQAYYSNVPVGIQDYVRCYKEVKSRLYNFKKLNK